MDTRNQDTQQTHRECSTKELEEEEVEWQMEIERQTKSEGKKYLQIVNPREF